MLTLHLNLIHSSAVVVERLHRKREVVDSIPDRVIPKTYDKIGT